MQLWELLKFKKFRKNNNQFNSIQSKKMHSPAHTPTSPQYCPSSPPSTPFHCTTPIRGRSRSPSPPPRRHRFHKNKIHKKRKRLFPQRPEEENVDSDDELPPESFLPVDYYHRCKQSKTVYERAEEDKHISFQRACMEGNRQWFEDAFTFKKGDYWPTHSPFCVSITNFQVGINLLIEHGHLECLMDIIHMHGIKDEYIWQNGYPIQLAVQYKQWQILHYLLNLYSIKEPIEMQHLRHAIHMMNERRKAVVSKIIHKKGRTKSSIFEKRRGYDYIKDKLERLLNPVVSPFFETPIKK